MAARRPSPICLLCNSRQASIGRRRTNTLRSRNLETLAVTRPEDDGFLLGSRARQIREQDVSSVKGTDCLKKSPPYSVLESHIFGTPFHIQSPDKHTDLSAEASGGIQPWLELFKWNSADQTPKLSSIQHILRTSPLPHAAFRELLKRRMQNPKEVKQLLRVQLLHCDWPKDVLRIVAAAFWDSRLARNLAVMYEPLMRAIYRCRINVSDPEILKLLSTILARFQHAKINVEPTLLFMALKFAARSRSLPGMKKLLRAIRQGKLYMSSHMFRGVVAKCSIGWRGLGEIRNGRWKRQELLEVLKGFEDCKALPLDQQYHLGSFMDRSDWQYLHGWIAVLSRCKDSEAVWQEWEIWKYSDARQKPRALKLKSNEDIERTGRRGLTTRMRGDYWFVEQMSYSGDIRKAWQILQETSINFRMLRTEVKDRLLDGIEHATAWDEQIRGELLAKYDRNLRKIERALGVRWMPGAVDGEGVHVMIEDQEEVLDRLGENGWELEPTYGYPHDDSPIVPHLDRPLHDAEESGRASV